MIYSNKKRVLATLLKRTRRPRKTKTCQLKENGSLYIQQQCKKRNFFWYLISVLISQLIRKYGHFVKGKNVYFALNENY